MNKGIPIALLAVGIMLCIWGVNASDSFSSDVSRFFTGAPTNKAVWLLIGGIVMGVAGLFGLVRGSKGTLKTVVITFLALTLCYSGAFAQEHRGDNRGDNRGGNRGYARENRSSERYYYRDGRWYQHGWFGFDFLVSALVVGAIIDALPPQHTTVVVQGTPYYYGDSRYYRQEPNGGYVVVSPPVLPTLPVQTQDTVTINIPNSRGGYTPVVLRRAGYGYLGPQGEYYADSPTVDQLRALYGNQ